VGGGWDADGMIVAMPYRAPRNLLFISGHPAAPGRRWGVAGRVGAVRWELLLCLVGSVLVGVLDVLGEDGVGVCSVALLREPALGAQWVQSGVLVPSGRQTGGEPAGTGPQGPSEEGLRGSGRQRALTPC